MALKHGNKLYYQVLLDPARAILLEAMAKTQSRRTTSLIREIVYEWLALSVDSDLFELASTYDAEVWKKSVRNRVDGKRKNRT